MDTSLGDLNGFVTDELIAYYEERAKGGVGGIIVEYTSVEGILGRQLPHQIRIDDDRYIEGLSKLRQAIQKHRAVPMIQVAPEGQMPVAPSPIPPRKQDPPPRELNVEEIEDLIQCFIRGAERAVKAGFHGLEIHGAHIYLIHQFLSPKLNKRRDQYGGSVENRARFLINTIKGIREKIGEDFPVWVRMNGDDFEEEGISQDDAAKTAQLCEDAGATAIHVSAGAENWRKPMAVAPIGYPEGLLVPLADFIKKRVNIPVITVGKIRTPELARQILEDGKADMVAIGRTLIADPYWPQKAEASENRYITPCIGCNECLTNILFRNKHIVCSTNPLVGYEHSAKRVDLSGSKILVIGGGAAGLTAGVRAAQSGAEVILVERNADLGGLLLVADIAPHKEDLTPLKSYLVNMAEKWKIDIHLNTEATEELIEKIRPDAVLIATGAKPMVPSITGMTQGLEQNFVLIAEDVLSGEKAAGRRVFILGGELTACEVGEYLLERGHEVVLGRRGSRFATKIEPVQRKLMNKRLTDAGATLIGGIKEYTILEREIQIETNDMTEKLSVDNIILAVGYEATGSLHDWIREVVPCSITIGDAREAGDILTCVREGWDAIDYIHDYVTDKLTN